MGWVTLYTFVIKSFYMFQYSWAMTRYIPKEKHKHVLNFTQKFYWMHAFVIISNGFV
ncbi:hypothetical protein HanIR_Chr17g0902791 [Helianthus annuus]|nr:hypothetical protein HanIR_Chr17g0902791 [Helianthus annuus]